jgi:hypothetical protein
LFLETELRNRPTVALSRPVEVVQQSGVSSKKRGGLVMDIEVSAFFVPKHLRVEGFRVKGFRVEGSGI